MGVGAIERDLSAGALVSKHAKLWPLTELRDKARAGARRSEEGRGLHGALSGWAAPARERNGCIARGR